MTNVSRALSGVNYRKMPDIYATHGILFYHESLIRIQTAVMPKITSAPPGSVRSMI